MNSAILDAIKSGRPASTGFSTGQIIEYLYDSEVRQGPGSNFPVFSNTEQRNYAEILDHQNGVNGISAKGDHWWLVDYNGTIGWSAESSFSLFIP